MSILGSFGEGLPSLKLLFSVLRSGSGVTGGVFVKLVVLLYYCTKEKSICEHVKQDIPHCTGYPPNLQCSLHALLSVPPGADYPSSLRPTMTACGDNLPRLMVVGACVGARLGLKAIPDSWLDRTLNSKQIVELATQLAALRKTLS